jgi:1,4-dihydroxy-2-naphthoate octaprenyltransferase
MTFRQFLAVVEIRTKIVSVSTFSISLAYVFLAGHRPSVAAVLLLFAAVLMVDMGTTAFNSFFDFVKGVDHHSLNREREKVLVHERVAPGAALLTAVGLFTAAALIGVYFAVVRGWPVLILGSASLITGMLYSGGRRPISHTPLGELFAGGFLGSILFMVIQYVLSPTGSEAWGTWLLLSLPSALLIGSILTVNNTCDLEADRTAGRRTLSIIIGREASEYLILALIVGAFAAAAALALSGVGGLHPLGAALPALFALPALATFGTIRRRGMVQERKGPSMGGISRIFALMSFGIISAQLLSLILL